MVLPQTRKFLAIESKSFDVLVGKKTDGIRVSRKEESLGLQSLFGRMTVHSCWKLCMNFYQTRGGKLGLE